jgi:FMN-binding domain
MRNVSPSSPRPPSLVPRRGLAALALTATATALLFSFRTPAEMFAGGGDGLALGPSGSAGRSDVLAALPPSTEPPTTVSPATVSPATEPPATEPPTSPPASVPQVLTGQVVRTPFGPVQVEITLDGTTISDVQALQLPSDRSYSRRISQVVEPMLRTDTLQVQSARIHLISGATYTSTGYAMSLQSALDQAATSANAPA